MHVHAFDQYHFSQSRIHSLDPRVKVLITVSFILSNALLPDGGWSGFALAWLMLLFANDQSGLGLGFTFKRNLGFISLIPTDYGVIRFLSVLARSWLSVQMAILLVATTQFPDLIHAFEHLRVPRSLTTVVAFLFRYLFVLTDEAFRLMRAREARSAGIQGTKRGGSLLWRVKVTGSMAGQLFLRSYERSDRIYQAMTSRGYTGHIRTLNPHEMTQLDWITLIFSFFVLILIQLVGWVR